MDYATFLRQAERGQLPGLVLIHGEDIQLLDDALEIVTRRLFPEPAQALFDREVLDARAVGIEVVVSAAQTLPVLAATRLVAARHAQALSAKGADVLARYGGDPNPAACLLLLADEALGSGRDRRVHWLLETVPGEAIVALVVRHGRQLEEWLRQRAATEGLTVSEEAAHLLVQWVGEGGAALLGEARKAALAGGPDNRAVGANEVTAVVGEHRVHGIFDLTRAIERHETGLALRTLDRLLATEAALFVLSALARDVRTAWTVREWRARGYPTEHITRLLRRPPAAVEAIVAAAIGRTPADFAARLTRCWEVEHRLKSGGEPWAEMAGLVTQLCGGAR